MALNPIVFTERVTRSFLRYQLTSYRFADKRLDRQMRTLLSLDETRSSSLLKGPYVSLSRPFRQGTSVEVLVSEGILHPVIAQRMPTGMTHVYGHQEEAIRAICGGKHAIISTGTGSGKTECFLYPIMGRCLQLANDGAAPGICAVIVYPMNALAEDQLGRLRGLLAGTEVPFGMYVGKTPESEAGVTGVRLPEGTSLADYLAKLEEMRREKRPDTVHPPKERCSRETMRKSPPRILLTNTKQLELLLTRQQDIGMFSGALLDFLVFDEAHTYTGTMGAETACLTRRLRNFCGRNAEETVCIATSATIVDRSNPGAAKEFASRFFGVGEESIVTVSEAYDPETWDGQRTLPSPPSVEPPKCLQLCVQAVDAESRDDEIRKAYRALSGRDLGEGSVPEALHAALSGNEIVWCINDALRKPLSLVDLCGEVRAKVGRAVTAEEVLSWLTLGAAARSGGRPLLRPVVHGFIRGIGGAVVAFPEGEEDPKLSLSAQDDSGETDILGEEARYAHFSVTTCTTCGQHYFIAYLRDFRFAQRVPEGGIASSSGGSYWEPLEEAEGSERVVLTDRLHGEEDDVGVAGHNRTTPLHFCRRCGAAHPGAVSPCLNCGVAGGMVRLHTIRQNKDDPGYLKSCISCGATGSRVHGRYREPARPVRATNVADVHVLAQDMVHHAERQRLLVFCDNRQDAAFQAGWMKDHARRFRMRALMASELEESPLSVGDLTHRLDELLARDDALSLALIPEVWRAVRKEGSGRRHERERRKYLRIQVLREISLASRQALGLEPWGRMKIKYQNLSASHKWIQEKADELGVPPEDFRDGIACMLDYLRRKRVLHDAEHEIFTHWWDKGDFEIQRGYLPLVGGPIGTKLECENEKPQQVASWLGRGGSNTSITQMVKKWGVKPGAVDDFLKGVFAFLTEELKLLKPVRLKGARLQPLPNLSGLYQVDADLLTLTPNHGHWKCRSCSRVFTRRVPEKRCPAWRCGGVLDYFSEKSDSDNYNLELLDQKYTMLKPEEHTAMVPPERREKFENLFKKDGDVINCFACTPTLEIGIDIGSLDAILMRNVPPLPANYWQRTGRAGRRHRMAVNFTYCRPMSHDIAYFTDPIKMLDGRVDPPSFNLRNELMVAKHVHAAMLTLLHQRACAPAYPEEERTRVGDILRECFPSTISAYLFQDGDVRTEEFDFSSLESLVDECKEYLARNLEAVFSLAWPEADNAVVSLERLWGHVDNAVDELRKIVRRLRRRLEWAMMQIERLNQKRSRTGTLEPADDALYKRCDRLLKRLKGASRRAKRETEGYDDIYTYGVLAAEGYLPGYGLEIGSVRGEATIPSGELGAMDFSLPRPPSMGVREYVPGNLIYANGNRFVPRRFHFGADEDTHDLNTYEVSVADQAVKEINAAESASTLDSNILQAKPICDVDLVQESHISDEEEFRFQMPVSVYGYERDRHNGGKAWKWGGQALQHRKAVFLRLVNVGAASLIAKNGTIGYHVCQVCGQSNSPYSSEAQSRHFLESHAQRCGKEVTPIGFYADVFADTVSLPGCPTKKVAFSVLETLRFAASRLLDMHLEDLQILVVGHIGREDVDAILWDTMPGGSGLLDQICARFPEVVRVAKGIASECPSGCGTSCIDCLRTFRNAFYHKQLDRQLAKETLDEWGETLSDARDIPPRQTHEGGGGEVLPVNQAESRLKELLERAGFGSGVRGEQIRLNRAFGLSTTPDVIYRAEFHEASEGVCIYLDGLSRHIHGNPETAERDRRIRDWLRSNGYEVIEIAVSDLHDKWAMEKHFRRLALYLQDHGLRKAVKTGDWF